MKLVGFWKKGGFWILMTRGSASQVGRGTRVGLSTAAVASVIPHSGLELPKGFAKGHIGSLERAGTRNHISRFPELRSPRPSFSGHCAKFRI